MSESPSTTAHAAVTLSRRGQLLVISPRCKAVERALRAKRWAAVVNPDGSVRVSRRYVPLFEVGPDDVLLCWIGLAPAVMETLHQAGFDVSAQHLGYPTLRLPSVEQREPQLTAFIAQHDRGLIRYDRDAISIPHLIAEIIGCWPDLSVMVIGKRRVEMRRLAKTVRTQCRLPAIEYVGDYILNQDARVIFATYGRGARGSVHPTNYDIVIVLDARESIGEWPSRFALENFDSARVYGLLPLDRALSPFEETRIREMFGFQELAMHQREHGVRPIEVCWIQSKGSTLRRSADGIVEVKRHGIWRNETRNRQIARVARGFLAGDENALTQMFSGRLPSFTPGEAYGVFVLVETVEHALALAPKLAGWPVFTWGFVNLEGLNDPQRTLLQERSVTHPLALPRFGITTLGGLPNPRLYWGRQHDVLIRADGGHSVPSLPNHAWLRPLDHALRPLTIVDFIDHHHHELARRFVKRWRAYAANGWPPPGVTSAQLRVHEFLGLGLRSGRKRGGR